MAVTGSNASQSGYVPYAYGPPLALSRSAVTGNYTVLATDYIVAYTALTTAVTVTLPSAQSAGRLLIIKDESGNCSSGNTITVSGMIDGASSRVLSSAYAKLRLYSNGVGWSVLT